MKKQFIIKALKAVSENLILDIYDRNVEKISKAELTKALNKFSGDSTDIVVQIRKKSYMLEISVDDNKVDLRLYTKEEYICKYGDEYEEEFI